MLLLMMLFYRLMNLQSQIIAASKKSSSSQVVSKISRSSRILELSRVTFVHNFYSRYYWEQGIDSRIWLDWSKSEILLSGLSKSILTLKRVAEDQEALSP